MQNLILLSGSVVAKQKQIHHSIFPFVVAGGIALYNWAVKHCMVGFESQLHKKVKNVGPSGGGELYIYIHFYMFGWIPAYDQWMFADRASFC